MVSGGDGCGVKLSMAVTARVIWLCACVRYCPYTAELVVSAEIDIIIIYLSSGYLEKLPITYQNAVRISARFTFCQPAPVEPGKSGLKKEVVL